MQIYEIFQNKKTKKLKEQPAVAAAPSTANTDVPASAVGGVPNPLAQRMPGGMATTTKWTQPGASSSQMHNAAYGTITSNVPQMQRSGSRAVVPVSQPAAQQSDVPAVQTGRNVATTARTTEPQNTGVPATVPGQGPRQQVNVDDVIDAPAKPGLGYTQQPGDVIDVDATDVTYRPPNAPWQQPGAQRYAAGPKSTTQPAAKTVPATVAQPVAKPAVAPTSAPTTAKTTAGKKLGAYDVMKKLAADYVSRKSGIDRRWIPHNFLQPTDGTAPTTQTAGPSATTAAAQPTAQPSAPAAPAAKPSGPTTTKKRTGGKVAGQVSQTPNAIRKRQARKKPATGAARAKPTGPMKGTKPGAPTSAEYANLERKLKQAMAQQAKKKK